MHKSKLFRILVLAMIFSMVLAPAAFAEESISTLADGPGDAAGPRASHRLNVELESLSLAEIQSNDRAVRGANTPDAQVYASQLQAEQADFVAAMQSADVLILDNDFSTIGPLIGELFFDYTWYYEQALEELGLTYDVYDVDADRGSATTIPSAEDLASYDALIWMTGDNFYPDGALPMSTGPTDIDQNKLTEYASNGGKIIAMGQDLAAVFGSDATDDGDFFYATTLGANWYQDSVSESDVPTETIVPTDTAPAAFAGVNIDISQPHYYVASGGLSGDVVVPPADTATTGDFLFGYNIDENILLYAVTVIPTTTTPISVTGAHLHQGAAGENGPMLASLDQDGVLPLLVTDTLTFSGSVSGLPANIVDAMLNGTFYINIHTTANPGGEARGQVEPEGVITQKYVDEIGAATSSAPGEVLSPRTILTYPGSTNLTGGGVGVINRDQLSLENPGITNDGRAAYTSFGLENMYEGEGNTTRSELLGLLLSWADSEAGAASIADTTPADQAGKTTISANYSNVVTTTTAVSYRWDLGLDDGSDYVESTSASIDHKYVCAVDDNEDNVYSVRVEVTDSMGNVAIGSADLDVSDSCQTPDAIDDDEPVRLPDEDSFIFLPVIVR